VLAGAPLRERPIGGIRAGALTGMPPLAPDAPATERDDRALHCGDRLERLGLCVEEVTLPVPEADIWPLFYAEALAVHRATFPARRDEYGPTVRAKLEAAQGTDPDAVRAARRALGSWRSRALAEPAVEVIVSPTLGLRELPAATVDELEIRVAFSAYTRAFSFIGWPAIAIGAVHFAARDVELLFAVARAWERAYGPP
jgi:hypothetical protein